MDREIMQKLDAPLTELYNANQLDQSSTLPVIIRVPREAFAAVGAAVENVGGRVRHQLKLFDAIAAWVPMSGLATIAGLSVVRSLEMEQEFSIA
jgi:hypothetical protein